MQTAVPGSSSGRDDAIARDASYAEAYALRSVCRQLLQLRGYRGAEVLQAAEADAQRALELAPDQAEVRGMVVLMQGNRGEWIAAHDNLERLRSADPADIPAGAAFTVNAMGHLGRAARMLEQASAQQLTEESALQQCLQHVVLGRTEQGRREVELALAMGMPPQVPPIPAVRSIIAVRQGDFAEAAKVLSEGLSPHLRTLGAEPVLRQVIAALGGSGSRAEASAALQRLAERAGVQGMILMENMMTVIWQTQLGNLDAAFSWAQQIDAAFRGGMVGRNLLYWMWIDEMRPFREDPRFQQFTEAIGLLDYWRQRGPPDLCTLQGGSLNCH